MCMQLELAGTQFTPVRLTLRICNVGRCRCLFLLANTHSTCAPWHAWAVWHGPTRNAAGALTRTCLSGMRRKGPGPGGWVHPNVWHTPVPAWARGTAKRSTAGAGGRGHQPSHHSATWQGESLERDYVLEILQFVICCTPGVLQKECTSLQWATPSPPFPTLDTTRAHLVPAGISLVTRETAPPPGPPAAGEAAATRRPLPLRPVRRSYSHCHPPHP